MFLIISIHCVFTVESNENNHPAATQQLQVLQPQQSIQVLRPQQPIQVLQPQQAIEPPQLPAGQPPAANEDDRNETYLDKGAYGQVLYVVFLITNVFLVSLFWYKDPKYDCMILFVIIICFHHFYNHYPHFMWHHVRWRFSFLQLIKFSR